MEAADARHLFRRLTFTSTPAMERDIGYLTPDDAVAALWVDASEAWQPDAPALVGGTWTNTALRTSSMTSAQYDARRAAQLHAAQRDIELLRQWWLGQAIGGEAPLRENLVLFFHGMFGSTTTAVDIPHALHGCNALLRQSCLGSIPSLLEALVFDPAMMIQIGMDEHGKDRVSDRPAKLILDYWTVGAGHYTDADVENLSRALTGWVLTAPAGQAPGASVDPQAPRAARRTGIVPAFVPAEFDAGPKTLLGTTRAFDARSAMRFLARHPLTARRFAQHLIRYLGIDDPAQQLETRLTDTYASTGGAVEALVIEIVRSKEFWSAESRWTLIKSPVHLASGACRQLEIASPPLAEISRWLTAAGQQLFDTPNAGEGGWPGQEAWVTPPDRLAIRYQLPVVLSGQAPLLGLQAATRAVAPTPLRVPVGPALRTASAEAMLTRLDTAPGLDAPEMARAAIRLAPAARNSDIIRRIMTTPQYQVA